MQAAIWMRGVQYSGWSLFGVRHPRGNNAVENYQI